MEQQVLLEIPNPLLDAEGSLERRLLAALSSLGLAGWITIALGHRAILHSTNLGGRILYKLSRNGYDSSHREAPYDWLVKLEHSFIGRCTIRLISALYPLIPMILYSLDYKTRLNPTQTSL